jgi:hypothetical protein
MLRVHGLSVFIGVLIGSELMLPDFTAVRQPSLNLLVLLDPDKLVKPEKILINSIVAVY